MDQAKSPKHRDPIVQRVIDALGGPTKAAEKLGITKGAPGQWTRIPSGRCKEVSRLTGIPLHELRPDIYPDPAEQPVDTPYAGAGGVATRTLGEEVSCRP